MSLRFLREVLPGAAASMALCGGLLATGAEASVLNHAAAFRWQGYVGTNLPLSSFYEDDHSVVVRFMASTRPRTRGRCSRRRSTATT